MTKEFSEHDFENLYDQTIVLSISITEALSVLSVLLPDLTQIQSQLSTLISKAQNPGSLLRKRCSDRHGDWLQIQYDLQDTLCEVQDVIDSLVILDESGAVEISDDKKFIKVQEDLGTHAFLIGEFIESLGLSKVARKDLALAEIERILVEAAREEREKDPEMVAEEFEENRLGGRYGIHRLLYKNGVDKAEIERLDTRIKQVVTWVFKNEPALTMVRDLEAFEENDGDKALPHALSGSERTEEQENLRSGQHEFGYGEDGKGEGSLNNLVGVGEQQTKTVEAKENSLYQTENIHGEGRQSEDEYQIVEGNHERDGGDLEMDEYVLV